jgi:hypothetical protein
VNHSLLGGPFVKYHSRLTAKLSKLLGIFATNGIFAEHVNVVDVPKFPLLGFKTRMQVHAFLKIHNVYLHYPIGELESDLASLKKFEETLTE